MSHPDNAQSGLYRMFEIERPRILGVCMRLTGDRDVAEDLTQETLIEAWRNFNKLREPEAYRSWLCGIARNVCKRWHRKQSLMRKRMAPSDGSNESLEFRDESLDLIPQLEHHELVELLDRALHLLPEVTRSVLVQQFIDERPQADIAGRLGLSRGAVAMRLNRGKTQLREVLVNQFPEDTASHGLLPRSSGWTTTRMWCRSCGRRRLDGSMNADKNELNLRCPECYRVHGLTEAQVSQYSGLPVSIHQFDGFRQTYERIAEFVGSYFRHALATKAPICLRCGHTSRLVHVLPAYLRNRNRESYGAQIQCSRCDLVSYCSLSGILLSSSDGRAFRRSHLRTRTLPEQEITFDGRPAVLSRFESVAGAGTSTLTGITDLETLRVLRFYQTP